MNLEARSAKGPVRVGRLVGGIVLCVFALGFLVAGFGLGIASTWTASRSAIAEAQGPGSLTFDAGDGKYVVALGTSEESWKNFELSKSKRWKKFRVYEGDVAAARCTIQHAKGADEEIRGDRQAASMKFGVHYATVGTFDGRNGETTVACVFDPPTETRFSDGESLGRREEVRRVPFMVHESEGLLGKLGWLFLGIGVIGAALGTLQILRATVWREPARIVR